MLRVLPVALLVVVVSLAALPAQQPGARPAQPSAPNDQAPDRVAFTDAEGADVLHAFAGSLEAHSLARFLAIFDAAAYPRFPIFAAEMDAYFGRYDQFRVHYNLKQTSTDANGHGILLAQMQIEATPFGTGEPVRRSEEVRFELARSGDKWKIVGFAPREFLS